MSVKNISDIGRLKLSHDLQISQNANNDFSKLLAEKMDENSVKFSKHAMMRMNERGVEFNENLQNDLNSAVEKARQKGAKDVIIIGDTNAFVVNIPNNTVVTTMNVHEMREKVFTNIDSAVIL